MIYALIDQESLQQRGISLESLVQTFDSQTIPLLQYRNKSGSLEAQRRDLQRIRACYQGKIIINDQIELINEADGLHLGQEDIRRFDENLTQAIENVRSIIGRKLLGLSTHNQAEILQANALDLDYIGLGAYRNTSTKKDANVLGDDALELAKLSTHPVGLIGGVKRSDRFGNAITYKVIGSDLYEN